MRVALVLNGAAGALLGRPTEATAARLGQILAEAGAEARVAVAEGPALCRALDAAIASDAEAILVGGGDGTIIAAAERLLPENRAGSGRPAGGSYTAWFCRGTAVRAALPRATHSAEVSRPSPTSSWPRAGRHGSSVNATEPRACRSAMGVVL